MSNNLYGQMHNLGYAPRLADASLTLVPKLYDFGDFGCRNRVIESYGPGGRFVSVTDALTFQCFCYDGATGDLLMRNQPTRFAEVKQNNPVLTGTPDSRIRLTSVRQLVMRADDIGTSPTNLYIDTDTDRTDSYKNLEDGAIPLTFGGTYLKGKLPSPWVTDGESRIALLPVSSNLANRPGLIWLGAVTNKTTGKSRLMAASDVSDMGLNIAATASINDSTGTPFEGDFIPSVYAMTNALNGNMNRGVAIVNVANDTYGVCFTIGVSNFAPLKLGSIYNNFNPSVHLVGAMPTGTNDFITAAWIDSLGKGQIYIGKSSEFANGKLTTTNNKTATGYSRTVAGSGHHQGSSKVMFCVGFMQDKGRPHTSPQTVNLWFDNGSATGAFLTFNIPSDSVFNAEVNLVAVGLLNTTSSTYQRRIVAVQRTRISDGQKFIQIWTRPATGSFTALSKYIPWPKTATKDQDLSGQIAQIRGRVVNTSEMQCDLILWNGVYRFTL